MLVRDTFSSKFDSKMEFSRRRECKICKDGGHRHNNIQNNTELTHTLLYADIGANPSTEEAEEGLDDSKTTVNNVIHSFRLQSTGFDKKGYLTYLKGKLRVLPALRQSTWKNDR